MYKEKEKKNLMYYYFFVCHLSSADLQHRKYFSKSKELPPKFTVNQFPSGLT